MRSAPVLQKAGPDLLQLVWRSVFVGGTWTSQFHLRDHKHVPRPTEEAKRCINNIKQPDCRTKHHDSVTAKQLLPWQHFHCRETKYSTFPESPLNWALRFIASDHREQLTLQTAAVSSSDWNTHVYSVNNRMQMQFCRVNMQGGGVGGVILFTAGCAAGHLPSVGGVSLIYTESKIQNTRKPNTERNKG